MSHLPHTTTNVTEIVPTHCADVTCIQMQCGISMDEAVEQYTKCRGDVVLAISSYFDTSIVTNKTATEQTNTDATHQALDTLRKIANEKDLRLNQILHKQKPPNTTIPSNAHDHHNQNDGVHIEELNED